MINIRNITCSSELHDKCGVVFGYEGKIYRGLYPRGKRIFDLLAKNGWMDRLTAMGLVEMRRTEYTLPGCETVIECKKISPVLAPTKWSTGMLCEAGKVVCNLSRELLRQGLIIWDLKYLSNMSYCNRQGPILLDLGAIYSIDELEQNVLDLSKASLLNQIASSFYVPLWLSLGRVGRFEAAKRFVAYRRRGPETFDLPAAILRRMSFEWVAFPGLWKAARLLKTSRYEEFFNSIAEQLQTWSDTMSAQSNLQSSCVDCTYSNTPQHQQVVSLLERVLGGLCDKTCYDLNPSTGYGLHIAHTKNSALYLLTDSESEANTFFAFRQRTSKPVLPVVCNIWDRSLKPAFALRGTANAVFILPDLFKFADTARVPIDFIGQVLALLTNEVAVVSVRHQSDERFPTFISPPAGSGGPAEFAKSVIGKHFASHEVVEQPGIQDSTLVVFRK